MKYQHKGSQRVFRVTPGRAALAAVVSAAVWFACFKYVSATQLLAIHGKAGVDGREAAAVFSLMIAWRAGMYGLIIAAATIMLASSRRDISVARRPGAMPLGQAMVGLQICLLGLGAGVFIAAVVAARVAPDTVVLRGVFLRALLGGAWGLCAGSVCSGLTFVLLRR